MTAGREPKLARRTGIHVEKRRPTVVMGEGGEGEERKERAREREIGEKRERARGEGGSRRNSRAPFPTPKTSAGHP